MRSPRLAPIFALAVSLSSASAIGAPPTPPTEDAQKAADALFFEGRKLMDEKNYAEACPKFEAAQKLRPGVGTLLNLGDCWEKLGKTASAWGAFRDATFAAQKAGDPREAVAKERMEALVPKLVKLTIEVPAASDLPGLEITRAGKPVDRAVWGTAVPVDPGSYKIEAKAPGRKAWSADADLSTASTTISVPQLEVEASAPEPKPKVEKAETPTTTPAATSSSQKTFALLSLGVGVVGLGMGTAFGLMSKSAHDEAERHCSGKPCDADGVAAGDRAIARGNVSTIAFVVGGVAVAGGVVLWLTAPRPESSSTGSLGGLSIVPSLGGLSLRGTFR